MRNAFSLVRSNGDPSVSKDQSLDTVYLRVILMVIGHMYVFYDTLMVETHLNNQSLVRCQTKKEDGLFTAHNNIAQPYELFEYYANTISLTFIRSHISNPFYIRKV